MQFGKEAGASRAVSAAVWCGIVPPLLLGLPCLGVLLYWLWQALSMKIPFAEALTMDKEMLAVISLLALPSLPLTFGIYKRSRICAAIVFLVFFALTVWDGVNGRLILDWSIVVPAVLILTSLLGLLGTIFHHRQKTKTANNPA